MKSRSPTLVTFHAHPDDEAIFTAGLVRAARRAGWRPVLVVATSGEEGAAPPGGGDTGAHRRRETLRSAEVLVYTAVHFLGYRDSGTAGSPATAAAGAFAAATVNDAAGRLAELIEGATVLTIYDAGGASRRCGPSFRTIQQWNPRRQAGLPSEPGSLLVRRNQRP